MRKSLEEVEDIVRKRVCSVCTERTLEGDCGREDPSSCALFRLFPNVARAIAAVSSDDIRDYVESLRKNVCTVCGNQAEDGTCDVRKQVQCALDAYLILVVDAIEEATGKTFDRTVLPPLAGGDAARFEAGQSSPAPQ
jgi:hypothetical protein